jgi:hypothetical protein
MTVEEWGDIFRQTMITQRRKTADRLREKAAAMGAGEVYFLGQTQASVLCDAAIAQWEADTLERDGELPDDYMAAVLE